MPAIPQFTETGSIREHTSPTKRPKTPPPLLLPLPPLSTQSQDLKITLTVNLSKPIGMRLNSECCIVEIFPHGQFGNMSSSVSAGYIVDLVDNEITGSFQEFQNSLKQARERGEKFIEIRCRPPKYRDPVRPYILQSLRNLAAADEFERNFKDVNLKNVNNKPSYQITYERGMEVFQDILKQVENRDYTWENCPPRANRSLQISRENIEAAARHKYPPAQNHLGMLYATGTYPVGQNLEEAVVWFKKGAENDNVDAQYNFANALFNGMGVARNHELACHWLVKSAEGGHAFAQSLSGLVFTRGNGVSTDLIRAASFWKDAARQREPEAESSLGAAFKDGKGFSNRNPVLAEELFRRAAEAGQPEASTRVGRLYQQDPSTLNQALQLTSIGAKRAHPPAMFDLAVMYHEGNKLPKDDALAYSWALGAATKGHAMACRLLAQALYEGWGGEEQLLAMKLHQATVEALDGPELAKLRVKAKAASDLEAQWIETRKKMLIQSRLEKEQRMMEEANKKKELAKEEARLKKEAEQALILAQEAKEQEEKAKEMALQEEHIRLQIALKERQEAAVLEKQRLQDEEAETVKRAIQAIEDLKVKERQMLKDIEAAEVLAEKLEAQEMLAMRYEDNDYRPVSANCSDDDGDRSAMLRSVFHQIDRNKLGEIQLSDFYEFLSHCGVQTTSQRCEDILVIYSEKSNLLRPGYLTLKECRKLFKLTQQVNQFEELDQRKNSYLTQVEIQQYLISQHNMDVPIDVCQMILDDMKSKSTALNPSDSNQIKLEQFVDFFCYLPLEVRLKAEAEVLMAKKGTSALLGLKLKLGMVVNPNGQVSKVTPNGQAEALCITPGCRIIGCDGQKVTDLIELKTAMTEAKARGEVSCELVYFDPKLVASKAALLGGLKAKASKAAAAQAEAESIEAKQNTRRSKLAAEAISRENEDARYRAQAKFFDRKLQRAFLEVACGGLEGLISQENLSELFAKMELGLDKNQMMFTLKFGLDSRRKEGVGLTIRECRTTLRIARLILAFHEMDLDRSGFIAENELKTALEKLGFDLKDQLIQCMVKKMDPNGDGEIVLTEFIDFFRFVAIDIRLRAEAEVLAARTGMDAVLGLKLKLGMVVNPNGQVSKVTPNGQAEALGITPGCRIVSVDGTEVNSLAEIKAAIAKAKKTGLLNCPLHFYDPRRFARATAQLARLRAEASASAAEAALEAEKAAEKARLKFEKEARETIAMNELRRQKAVEAAALLAAEHERARVEARQLAATLAKENKQARDAAEEEARQFERRAEEAQERARVEAKRVIDEENTRQAQEAAEVAYGESLKDARASASRAVHQVIMAEVEAGKRAEEEKNRAKEKAFEWWEKSSSLGCLDASNDLAMCLAYGDGCEADTVRARKVWEDAVKRGHAPSMHNFAMSFINRTGMVLRFMGGGPGNMERATELLVAAARKGYQESMEFLYKSQPLSFRIPTDFEPRPMPPMKFADTIVGRRVEVHGYQKGDSRFELNGMYGTVEMIRPAAGKFMVRLEDYSLVAFNRNHIWRPFVAALSEDLIQVPPPPPMEMLVHMDPSKPLGIDAESDTLLVTKVNPKQQAWTVGVRPGHTLASVCGIKVRSLDEASSELVASKDRRDDTCEIIFHVIESRPKGFF